MVLDTGVEKYFGKIRKGLVHGVLHRSVGMAVFVVKYVGSRKVRTMLLWDAVIKATRGYV